MLRVSLVAAFLISLTSANVADAAESRIGATGADTCSQSSTATLEISEYAPNDLLGAPEVTLERAPDPIQAPASAERLVPGLPVVSETVRSYVDEHGFTHTIGEIIQGRTRPESTTSSSGGGRFLAAPMMLGTCYWWFGENQTVYHTVCGGGCMTQYLRRTIDAYTIQGFGDPYWQRVEVRLWWERQGSTYINFGGSAYTQWNEQVAWDCNGNGVGRLVYNNLNPQWQTSWRTYDYYWSETHLPKAHAPDSYVLKVWTQTPTNFFGNLYTEKVNN